MPAAPLSDKEIWQLYTKEVRRLSAAAPAPKTKPKTAVAKGEKMRALLASSKIVPSKPQKPDLQLQRDVRSGKTKLDAKIDLHGLTEAVAHKKLTAFVLRQKEAGAKRLLVITGKGREGKSILRQNMPRWCEAGVLSRYVSSVSPASVKHGGDGAFYVFLK